MWEEWAKLIEVGAVELGRSLGSQVGLYMKPNKGSKWGAWG